MSATDEAPEERVDTENVGGLGEIIPEPLMPIWSRVQLIQKFRDTHGERYTSVLEALVALALIGGYIYWLYLFYTG